MITTKQRRAVTTILSAWLVGGTFDITMASIYYPLKYNITQILLLQNIASGVFGERAFSGGLRMAVLGLAFHYCIAFFWTIIFFISYTAIEIFRRNWFITGMAYGLVVWLVMNLVVLPMSNVSRSPSFSIRTFERMGKVCRFSTIPHTDCKGIRSWSRGPLYRSIL